ncbi:MAG: hypothetical protein KME12_05780 [Trichocoleus desertorum ATA4-8-CV12]|nr:hypothetical protein [Trichocoleus desertorum ATA4-8-CV12]
MPIQKLANIQYSFFQLLLREPIKLSLCHFYDPKHDSKQSLRIFLMFGTEIQDLSKQKTNSILQTSEFYQIYPFQPIDLSDSQFDNITNLDWVNALVEIHKAETISDKGYYLPHLFPTNDEHDLVKVCEQLAQIHRNSSPEKILLEITLQPYSNQIETAQWQNALDTLLDAHTKATNASQDGVLETIVKGIRDYQTRYSHAPLFNYSIKLLAESDLHLSSLAFSWLQNATSTEYANLHRHLPIIKRGEPGFQESLQATREVRVPSQTSCIPPNLQTWEPQFGDRPIREIFGSPSMYWGDGSTKRPPHYTPPPQPPAPSQPNLSSHSSPTPSSSSLVTTGSHAITPWQGSQHQQREPAKMRDLLPLRYLTTLDEISSFLRVVIPGDRPIPGMPLGKPSYPNMTAEQMFNEHRQLITPDTYIVGLDDNSNIITSSWDEIPHRLVAGQTGFGKTNFLKWLLFQFFYANPSAKVYAMDFKGIDFPALKTLLPNLNIEVVTEVEEALGLIEKIDQEADFRANLIRSYPGAGKLSDLQDQGVTISRTLWVIDEAADIADAPYSLAEEVEKRLKAYARKGRSFGIHVIYAAQCPDSSVISKQVTRELGEKAVFKVTADASMNVLEIDTAEHIDRKGRAILHRGIGNWIYVNTPEMPNLSKRPLATTVWGRL